MRTQDNRALACALVQSTPSELRGASRFGGEPGRAGSARDRYEIGPRITHVDRAIIRGYLHQYHFAQTPDPGLRPRMAGDSLPHDTRMEMLPAELERILSALPAGYQRGLVGHDVVLVRSATREIIDVMRNARVPGTQEVRTQRRRIRLATSTDRPEIAREDSAARWRLYERVAVL